MGCFYYLEFSIWQALLGAFNPFCHLMFIDSLQPYTGSNIYLYG